MDPEEIEEEETEWYKFWHLFIHILYF
jgi:hypothetical protein